MKAGRNAVAEGGFDLETFSHFLCIKKENKRKKKKETLQEEEEEEEEKKEDKEEDDEEECLIENERERKVPLPINQNNWNEKVKSHRFQQLETLKMANNGVKMD